LLLAVETVVDPYDNVASFACAREKPPIGCVLRAPALASSVGIDRERVNGRRVLQRLHQREHSALWQSQVERRKAGHVIREQEIETVDGPAHRLLSIDGHEPSPSERKQNDERLRDLMQNPHLRLELKKKCEADEKLLADLLRVVPDALFFEDQGTQGSFEKLAFGPNATYKPKTNDEKVLHAMSGVILIDLDEKRLPRLSATLTQQVDFGYGVRLAPGIWKTSSFRIDINGRFVSFKTLNKQQDEAHSAFKSVAPDTTILQAQQQIGGK
jgi:hypothetical protein